MALSAGFFRSVAMSDDQIQRDGPFSLKGNCKAASSDLPGSDPRIELRTSGCFLRTDSLLSSETGLDISLGSLKRPGCFFVRIGLTRLAFKCVEPLTSGETESSALHTPSNGDWTAVNEEIANTARKMKQTTTLHPGFIEASRLRRPILSKCGKAETASHQVMYYNVGVLFAPGVIFCQQNIYSIQ